MAVVTDGLALFTAADRLPCRSRIGNAKLEPEAMASLPPEGPMVALVVAADELICQTVSVVPT